MVHLIPFEVLFLLATASVWAMNVSEVSTLCRPGSSSPSCVPDLAAVEREQNSPKIAFEHADDEAVHKNEEQQLAILEALDRLRDRVRVELDRLVAGNELAQAVIESVKHLCRADKNGRIVQSVPSPLPGDLELLFVHAQPLFESWVQLHAQIEAELPEIEQQKAAEMEQWRREHKWTALVRSPKKAIERIVAKHADRSREKRRLLDELDGLGSQQQFQAQIETCRQLGEIRREIAQSLLGEVHQRELANKMRAKMLKVAKRHGFVGSYFAKRERLLNAFRMDGMSARELDAVNAEFEALSAETQKLQLERVQQYPF